MNNPPVAIELHSQTVYQLESFLRAQTAYFSLPSDASEEAVDQSRQAWQDAAVSFAGGVFTSLQPNAHGTLGEALSECKTVTAARLAAASGR